MKGKKIGLINIDHLAELEAEAIYVLRETLAQFNNPVILFSGGKDSIVASYLARKAFLPMQMPFKLLHIDTGHNFEETLSFRDWWGLYLNTTIEVALVQDSIDQGLVKEETGPNASRNILQTTTLRTAIQQHGFDAAVGGGRRDEEKARAKERFFSHRDHNGGWNPVNQRPELWNLYNGEKFNGEHFRVFPLSNWTELDIWSYIHQEKIPLPSLYFAHERLCIKRKEVIFAYSPYLKLAPTEQPEMLKVRFRTIGDYTITGAVVSNAATIEQVIAEIAVPQTTERGTRPDDMRAETAMEDRKKEGYF